MLIISKNTLMKFNDLNRWEREKDKEEELQVMTVFFRLIALFEMGELRL